MHTKRKTVRDVNRGNKPPKTLSRMPTSTSGGSIREQMPRTPHRFPMTIGDTRTPTICMRRPEQEYTNARKCPPRKCPPRNRERQETTAKERTGEENAKTSTHDIANIPRAEIERPGHATGYAHQPGQQRKPRKSRENAKGTLRYEAGTEKWRCKNVRRVTQKPTHEEQQHARQYIQEQNRNSSRGRNSI